MQRIAAPPTGEIERGAISVLCRETLPPLPEQRTRMSTLGIATGRIAGVPPFSVL